MGDRMTQIPFQKLLDWTFEELETKGTVFGVYRPFQAEKKYNRTIFGRSLETPIGPAAGPHTQLAQNIVAAYYAGSRFFELKTVQTLDGEDLPVAKPCIKADDECYNVEWSTELYVPQALEEYIKAWFLCNVMAKELELGSMDGFQFNMSVGYDLEGIQSKKIDTFIESLKDASDTDIFKHCQEVILNNLNRFRHITREDVEQISSKICNSVTLSTLHGCPPQEIEKIAKYLIEEKGLNTFVKCNPTLLGFPFARKTMDEMGYDYVAFGDFHFLDDLQYEDAIPMLRRLMELAEQKNLEFGVKITNTFPVDIKQGELPGEEMYMSGKSLYPLSIAVAFRLAKDFEGKLRIAYSGGADYYNIKKIVETGIWPVTVATTLLKPGGYQRIYQMAELTREENAVFDGVDAALAEKLAAEAVTDAHHVKSVKILPSRKIKRKVPLTNCFIAPCKEGCPIHQDITTYMKLAGEGKYEEALTVITEKNPLPFITGTICAHNCMSKCTRNFYEEPVQIREMKLLSAESGFDSLVKKSKKTSAVYEKKTAVIGGGPAGLCAAFFLAREGMNVTLFEKEDSLGGVIRQVIPEFRISEDAIGKDIEFIKAMGMEVRLNTKVNDLDEIKKQGYDSVIVAAGAAKHGELKLETGENAKIRNAIEFLTEFKKEQGNVSVGKTVVVIGGGNTAMDTARAAKRTKGVEKVLLVYRRTKRYMPADAEELELALEDGVEFMELLAPKSFAEGQLLCQAMTLTAADESGRCNVAETDKTVVIQTDTVIAAVGEQVPTEFYTANGMKVTGRGKALVNEDTLESSQTGIYVIGDGLNGPATVVEAIRDARKAAEAILHKCIARDFDETSDDSVIYAKRGILADKKEGQEENTRCLTCSSICENCVEVCPNRANIRIMSSEFTNHQIIHVDSMCNECGNCKSFCPYDSAPYLDKFTLFANEADMKNSKNEGFTVLEREHLSCKVRLGGKEFIWNENDLSSEVSQQIAGLMKTVCRDYEYLL